MQVTVRGIFDQGANEEADKLLRSKTNILNISGTNIRTTEKEAIQTIFNLTKADF